MCSSLPAVVIALNSISMTDRKTGASSEIAQSISAVARAFLSLPPSMVLRRSKASQSLSRASWRAPRLRRKKPIDSGVEKTVEVVVARVETRPFRETGHGCGNRSLDGTVLAHFIGKTVSGEDPIDVFDEFLQSRFPVESQMVMTHVVVPTDMSRFTDIARDELDEIQYCQGGWQGIRRWHPRRGMLVGKVVNLSANRGLKERPRSFRRSHFRRGSVKGSRRLGIRHLF